MSSWSLSQRKQNSMGDFFISSCYLNNSLFFIPRLLSSCVVQAIKAGHKNDQRIWNCTLMSVIFVETFSNWKCKNKLVGYILKTSCFKTIKIMTLVRPILTISVSFLFFLSAWASQRLLLLLTLKILVYSHDSKCWLSFLNTQEFQATVKINNFFQNWKDQIIVDYLPDLVKFLFFHFMRLLFTSPRTNKTY